MSLHALPRWTSANTTTKMASHLTFLSKTRDQQTSYPYLILIPSKPQTHSSIYKLEGPRWHVKHGSAVWRLRRWWIHWEQGSSSVWVCIGHESFRDLRESWRLEREIFWREGREGWKGKNKWYNKRCTNGVSDKHHIRHFVKPLDV